MCIIGSIIVADNCMDSNTDEHLPQLIILSFTAEKGVEGSYDCKT